MKSDITDRLYDKKEYDKTFKSFHLYFLHISCI